MSMVDDMKKTGEEKGIHVDVYDFESPVYKEKEIEWWRDAVKKHVESIDKSLQELRGIISILWVIIVVIGIMALGVLFRKEPIINIGGNDEKDTWHEAQTPGFVFVKGHPESGFIIDSDSGRCFLFDETSKKVTQYDICRPSPNIKLRDAESK